jgi:hypothetical protein
VARLCFGKDFEAYDISSSTVKIEIKFLLQIEETKLIIIQK